MNNTKWYELFHLIYTKKVTVQKLRIKFLVGDQIFSYPVPDLGEFDKFGFSDGGHPGPFKYNEIEYLEVAKQIIVERKNREETLAPIIILQDIEMISELCENIGQLLVEYTEGEKIRIYGYK
jgi:hypothetical protein